MTETIWLLLFASGIFLIGLAVMVVMDLVEAYVNKHYRRRYSTYKNSKEK